jgi:glycine/D-amino acid oxidase-like deaminating enzyme
MQVDYIIAGQGIAGSLLAWQLSQRGQRVLVYDAATQNASTASGGLINPVTGKRIVKTWMYDELLASAIQLYTQLSVHFGQQFLTQKDILNFFATRDEEALFDERMHQQPLLRKEDAGNWQGYFHHHYGVGKISPSYVLNVQGLLAALRDSFAKGGMLVQEHIDWSAVEMGEGQVRYKDVVAKKIICCEGAATMNNPYFSLLPLSLNKGEVIIANIPGLPQSHVYYQGIKILPLSNGMFWVGSSFDWKYEHLQPTEAFRHRVEEQLNYWLKLPYTITAHYADVRPSVVDHRLLCGIHPKHPQLGILNGLGTKGCSLSPYFSAQLADHLVNGTAILPDADINRFKRILSR